MFLIVWPLACNLLNPRFASILSAEGRHFESLASLLWMDEIRSHHVETIVETIFVGIYGGIIIPGIPGFLAWCKMNFATIHSMEWFQWLAIGTSAQGWIWADLESP